MCEPGNRCDETEDLGQLLAEVSKSPGYEQYANLIAAKFGVPAAEIQPYLVACSLEVSAMMLASQLKDFSTAVSSGKISIMLELLQTTSMIAHLDGLARYAGKQLGRDIDAKETVIEAERIRSRNNRLQHFETGATAQTKGV